MTDLQWGRLSNDAFNVALFAYIVAMVGYFAYLAFRRTLVLGRCPHDRVRRVGGERGLRS